MLSVFKNISIHLLCGCGRPIALNLIKYINYLSERANQLGNNNIIMTKAVMTKGISR